MTRWLVACAIAAVCLIRPAFAAGATCTGDVSLSLDYLHGTVGYDASGISAACLDGLASLGVPYEGRWPAANNHGTWSVRGQVPSAQLAALPEGPWSVQVDLDLQPDDVLRVSLPFTAIDIPHLDPPPANLQVLTAPSTLALDGRSAPDTLEYRGS